MDKKKIDLKIANELFDLTQLYINPIKYFAEFIMLDTNDEKADTLAREICDKAEVAIKRLEELKEMA